MDVNEAFAPLGEDRGRANERRSDDPWRPILPVPDDAPQFTTSIINRFAPEGFAFTAGWRYPDAEGHLLGFAVRYDRPANGKPADKQVKPFTFCSGPNGKQDWRCKGFPDPRPLYGLDRLAARPAAPVLVVEGEKAADAAATRFADHVVITSPGGSKAARKTGWQEVAGRNLTIWPDADEPGTRYADDVADMARQAGAASVRLVKLPAGLPDGWDLANDLPAGLTDADLARMLSEAAAAPNTARDNDPWYSPDLTLLGTGRRPAPDFPLDLLGAYWSPWIERRAAGASAPVDYVATSLLACVGAMIANVRWPVAGASWSEPPLLWCGIVGSPSSSKSPAMDAAFDLVRHAEDRMAAGFDEEQRRHETAKQIAKAKRDAWEGEIKAAIKSGETPPNMPEDAVTPDEPVRPRVRVADFTIEKLGALTAALPRGLLVVRDELAGWLGAFDKYGGGGSDRAFAIEMYGGRSYIVDRVKNPEPLRIRHLSVGVLGGVQPDKLSAIIEGPDDGLASRLLWAWPDSLPQFSLSRLEADDTDARAAFARLADLAMGSDDYGTPEPKRLKLTAEAENVLEDFARDMAKRANETAGMFSGALGKARGHALRLAVVLEHLWWCGARAASEPTAVSAKAVASAAGLLDGYFIPMAERVFGDASIPVTERGAMILIRYVKRNGLVSFNARDVRREIGGELREATAMEAACAVLVEAGLIKGHPSRAGEIKGRTAKNYDVNPVVFGEPA